MPSDLFYRLPISKQELIKQAALKEFSQKSFDSAKMINICNYANIPRRTFYSYFDSMEDLYSYIFNNLTIACHSDTNQPICDVTLEKYFMNILSSDTGLVQLYELLALQPEAIQNACHIAISLSLKRKLNLLTQNDYILAIEQLFTGHTITFLNP